VYLQVVEELAGAWLTVGLGLSVHTLACFPLAVAGTAEQQQAWLPELLGGGMLGAYCLSEPQSGSDAAALRTRAVADGTDYVVDGVKSWISHAGQADF
jgi:alkylation response protein AidB-like acyl-CoA dehydrogenase